MDVTFMRILILVALVGIVVFCFITTGSGKSPKRGEKAVFFTFGLLALGLFGFYCVLSGQGYVPSKAQQSVSERLSSGNAYDLVAAVQDGKDEKVLTIMKEGQNADGTHDFYALRVHGPLPPERFTIIGDKALALMPLPR